MKRRLVISAVNLTEGGPLTVLRQCLESALRTLPSEWEIIALVHSAKLVGVEGIQYIEFTEAKHSWAKRLYFEFWKFNQLSKHLKPDFWLSLHDISPRVSAPKQAVYCHNPSPFYKPRLREAMWEPGFFLFCLFYRFLYRININANRYVIVQQEWIRQAFQKMFGLTNVIVAHPVTNLTSPSTVALHINADRASKAPEHSIFLYPALPRVFKNFEVACEAAERLFTEGYRNFELRLTFNGNESRYARYIHHRFKHVPTIRFIGRQSSEAMVLQYQQATAVVFPSKLETWGLPISEAKQYDQPILLADLPYAHEALGMYEKAGFFNPNSVQQLAMLMKQQLSGHPQYSCTEQQTPTTPFAPDWDNLLSSIIAD